MSFDIRQPIGLMFGILGLLLFGYGLISASDIYDRSLGINVNVIWGAVLIVFAVILLGLSRFAKAKRS